MPELGEHAVVLGASMGDPEFIYRVAAANLRRRRQPLRAETAVSAS